MELRKRGDLLCELKFGTKHEQGSGKPWWLDRVTIYLLSRPGRSGAPAQSMALRYDGSG